jgi:hypothetical protein
MNGVRLSNPVDRMRIKLKAPLFPEKYPSEPQNRPRHQKQPVKSRFVKQSG